VEDALLAAAVDFVGVMLAGRRSNWLVFCAPRDTIQGEFGDAIVGKKT